MQVGPAVAGTAPDIRFDDPPAVLEHRSKFGIEPRPRLGFRSPVDDHDGSPRPTPRGRVLPVREAKAIGRARRPELRLRDDPGRRVRGAGQADRSPRVEASPEDLVPVRPGEVVRERGPVRGPRDRLDHAAGPQCDPTVRPGRDVDEVELAPAVAVYADGEPAAVRRRSHEFDVAGVLPQELGRPAREGIPNERKVLSARIRSDVDPVGPDVRGADGLLLPMRVQVRGPAAIEEDQVRVQERSEPLDQDSVSASGGDLLPGVACPDALRGDQASMSRR